jgi:hypothetical protein
MTPHLEVLPAGQREFWDRQAGKLPRGWVLYGGTAIALRFGHRNSIDFDFFSHQSLDEALLRQCLPAFAHADMLQRQPETLVTAAVIAGQDVRISFFGNIKFGRVGVPDSIAGKVPIASPLDLLATKLKTILQRIEAKDYLDIEVLLRSGMALNRGISAAAALYPHQLNPLDVAKAVGWFKDGDLESLLPRATKDYLADASTSFDATVRPMALAATTLS